MPAAEPAPAASPAQQPAPAAAAAASPGAPPAGGADDEEGTPSQGTGPTRTPATPLKGASSGSLSLSRQGAGPPVAARSLGPIFNSLGRTGAMRASQLGARFAVMRKEVKAVHQMAGRLRPGAPAAEAGDGSALGVDAGPRKRPRRGLMPTPDSVRSTAKTREPPAAGAEAAAAAGPTAAKGSRLGLLEGRQ